MKFILRIYHLPILIIILYSGIISCSNSVEPPNINDINIGESLVLSPNECFFFPTGTLKNVEDPNQTGTEANRNAYFTHITDWRVPDDTIIWAVDIEKEGDLIITPVLEVKEDQISSTIDIYFNKSFQTIELLKESEPGEFLAQDSVTFHVSDPGRYTIELKMNTPVISGKNVADVQKVILTGKSIENASVVIKRWRPYAIHARWGNRNNPTGIRLAIHENTIVSTDTPMYQPITTPFGYVGSTWDPNTQTFNGFNFSLWSYGQNDPEPPIEQLSHLIAVGKGLHFGHYGHEGTGVKPRGPSPYEKYQNVNTQTIALRKEPGVFYDTYYTYYLDPDSQEWFFYGSGKKYNENGTIADLWTGAFVEQPGPSFVERSGHLIREVNYRGWYMDESGNWYNIDQMRPGGSLSDISYKKWGITDDNRYFMQMGGFGENDDKPFSFDLINLPDVTDRPDYLKGERLNQIYSLPAEIDTLAPKMIDTDHVLIQFDLKDTGTNPAAIIYWGESEGLTLVDEWDQKKQIQLINGLNEISLVGLNPGVTYYYRLRIENEEGITWSMHTQTFTTATPD